MLRTNVYIDGFNLYYGALRKTPYRWLDLRGLCRRILRSGHDLQRIRYFTADVKPSPSDRGKDMRQQLYQRALRTLPETEIHKGRFVQRPRWMPLARPIPGILERILVDRVEEKGSDVNLATYLMLDAAQQDFQAAYVMSNDTDLVEPIRLVRQTFSLPVHVVSPHRTRSRRLEASATSYALLDHTLLPECQFPRALSDRRGAFHKPPEWDWT
ncbi:MAG: NYN domain-containing protein [Chloroflexota bacterium]|nr:NYN domain-containing protein [Chloroflexota bacterium]MDE2920897.1 NYN domain-containing protein [Chloroflexota bacterium]